MKKKRSTIILIITIFLSVIFFNYDKPIIQERKAIENLKTNNGFVKSPLIYGLTEGAAPAVLDPVDSWDSASNDVIRHVCDNLWYNNLSDPDLALEMRLATSYEYNGAKDEVEVILRENVYFHDGSYFNATAVKYTFDRILYHINATGTLPPYSRVCEPNGLFFDMHGVSILNKTVINSEYNITFYLNAPNAIFIPLLTYDACAILHPASTPATTFLELGTDVLVGTGPFEYIHFIEGEELKFVRNEMYWGGKANLEEIIFKYYPDSVTTSNALLGGEAHFIKPLTSMIDLYIADPDIVFTNLRTSTIYRYFGLNNNKINEPLIRKAICYAFNYSYYINVIRQGYGIRAHQMLPPGFPYYNATFFAPTLNVSIARQAMMDAFPTETTAASVTAADYNGGDANDVAWALLNLATYRILQHEGWDLGIDMNAAFAADMDRVGISVVPDVMDWETYIYVTIYDEDRLEIFHTGWGPDYLDPFNMVAPLLSNLSSANHIQNHDALIMGWLADYEQESIPAEKTKLLWKIQNRAINEIYAELPVQYDMVMYVHHKNLTGFPYNIRNHLYFYPCNGSFSVPAPDYPPTSNHPNDFFTSLGGSETINWILYDDFGGGQYRVWATDTNGDYYIWVDWTPWTNNTPLNVPINRTVTGVYNYTIEYYDDYNQFGAADIVIVTLTDMNPSSNHPIDFFTALGGSETIDWILYDDLGGGQYRVWANDINDNYYIWVDWTPWTNNTLLNVAINRTSIGIYNYTIEYYDNNVQFGNPDTVIVVITEVEGIPSSNHPEDFVTTLEGSETIDWILYDDLGGDQYCVWVNDTNGNYYIWVDWTPWTNNTPLNVPINRTSIGFYYYTIEYNNTNAHFGNPDTVIVAITEDEVTPSSIPGPNVMLISMISLLAIVFLVNNILRKRNREH